MLGFPASTEFGKRIPKQKFYENLEVSPALRRVFVDQIRLVYWRNKLAASTLNIAVGEAVTEIEVFEVRLNDPQLDEAVLKQIDKEIPYQMLASIPILTGSKLRHEKTPPALCQTHSAGGVPVSSDLFFSRQGTVHKVTLHVLRSRENSKCSVEMFTG